MAFRLCYVLQSTDANLVTSIAQISGTDGDQRAPYNSVHFELSGGDDAKEFFLLNTNTGHISAKKSLQLDEQKQGDMTVRTSAIFAQRELQIDVRQEGMTFPEFIRH